MKNTKNKTKQTVSRSRKAAVKVVAKAVRKSTAKADTPSAAKVSAPKAEVQTNFLKTNLVNRSSIKTLLANKATEGDPLNLLVKYGKFMGCRSAKAGDGPGQGYWNYMLQLHREIRFENPFVVVWLPQGWNSDLFCADCNDGMDYGGDRYLLQLLNQLSGAMKKKGVRNLNYYWFQSGDDPYSPAECGEAYEWIQEVTGGAATGDGPIAVFHYPYGDQTKWFSFARNPTVESFKTKLQSWVSKLVLKAPSEDDDDGDGGSGGNDGGGKPVPTAGENAAINDFSNAISSLGREGLGLACADGKVFAYRKADVVTGSKPSLLDDALVWWKADDVLDLDAWS